MCGNCADSWKNMIAESNGKNEKRPGVTGPFSFVQNYQSLRLLSLIQDTDAIKSPPTT